MRLNFAPYILAAGAVATALLSGCGSTSRPKESGFLSEYSLLAQEKAPGGGTRLVYANPRFTPAHYSAVWLEPVEYFPTPQPSEDVTLGTLLEIRDAINGELRRKIGEKVRLAERPGPGVARIRIAVTAVGASTRALETYQYIPIALVMTGAKAAMDGGLPRDATVAIESRVTDTLTDELLYASVRGGTGERVANATQGQGGVRLSALQPLIDEWTSGAANEIQKYVRAK
jgi:hypothetical protein